MVMVVTCPGCGLQAHLNPPYPEQPLNCPRCGRGVPIGTTSVREVRLVDQVFAGLTGAEVPDRNIAPSGLAVAAPQPKEPPAEAPPSPPPVGVEPAALSWLRQERERLEVHTRKQFTLIQQQRQEVATWHTQVEARLVSREQEMNRLHSLLTSRTEALEQREREFASQAAALAQADRDLLMLEERAAELRGEAAALRSEVGRLRAEAASLEEMLDGARHEYAALDAAIQQQTAAEKVLDERQAELTRRLAAVERAEIGVQRRHEEIEDLERHIRQELEDREHQLILREQAVGRPLAVRG